MAGAIVRVAALPLPGTRDTIPWRVCSSVASREGVSRLYGVGGSPPEWRQLSDPAPKPLPRIRHSRFTNSASRGAVQAIDGWTVSKHHGADRGGEDAGGNRGRTVCRAPLLRCPATDRRRRRAVGDDRLLAESGDRARRRRARLSRPAVHAADRREPDRGDVWMGGDGRRVGRRRHSHQAASRDHRARGGARAVEQPAARRTMDRCRQGHRRRRGSDRGARPADRRRRRRAEHASGARAARRARHAVGQRLQPVVVRRLPRARAVRFPTTASGARSPTRPRFFRSPGS